MIDENYSNQYSNKRLRDISDTTNNTNITPNAKLGLNYDPEKLRNETRRKTRKTVKKNFLNLINLEGLEENIDLIRSKYFEKPENKYKGDEFREKYHKFLNGGYLDLLLLMKEYPEFNLFDYINTDFSLYNDESRGAKSMRHKSIVLRNNLFIRIMIEASQIYSSSNERNRLILDDMSFLKPQIENFKNIICDREKWDILEIDVEVFFLTILGYKDKAKTIVVKFYDYFKKFMRDFSESDSQAKNIFDNLDVISDKNYIDMSDLELIVIRKIINNCIKRKFYRGIEFLCENEIFCCCMTEGRIWKSIIKHIQTKQILIIWDIYYSIISINRKPLRPTLQDEYSKKLSTLNLEDPRMKLEKKEKEKEINLDFVYDFKSFLTIIFKCNKTEIAMEAINHMLIYYKELIGLEIFEVCLEYDEDISIELLEKVINSENAQDYHMKLALMKKYFRLACKLIKYKTCKNYLNIPRPTDDNENYVFIMNRFQLEDRQKIYEKLEKEGLKDKNENKDDYFKLLSIFSENEDEKKENESIKDIIFNDENPRSLLDNSSKDKDKFGSTKFDKLIYADTVEIFPKKFKSKRSIEIIYDNLKFQKKYEKSLVLLDNLEQTQVEFDIQGVQGIQGIGKGYSKVIGDLMKQLSSESNKSDINEIDYDNRSLFHPDRDKVEGSFGLIGKKSEEEIEMINFVGKSIIRQTQKNLVTSLNIENLDKKQLSDNIHNTDKLDLPNLGSKRIGKSSQSVSSEPDPSMIKENTKEQKEFEGRLSMLKKDDKPSVKSGGTKTPMSFRDLLESKTPINIQTILIDHLRWGQHTFYCVCLLSSVSDRYLNTEYSEKICKSLIVFSRDEEAISRCRTPLILCVLTAEFLIKLGKLNTKYQYKCRSIAEIFLKLGECLQASIKDEEMLNYYLREQIDHKKRSALEIIAENRFYDLLDDENVATIVGKLWYGTGRDLSIFRFSRIWRIMLANIKHEHYEDLVITDMKSKVYSFQYCQYTKNCSVRYLVDSMSTIMTTILYQVIIYFYVSISSQKLDPRQDQFFLNLNLIANIIVFTINLNLMMYMLYVYLTNRTLKITAFILLDIVMFLGVLCNMVKLSVTIFPNDQERIQFCDACIYSVVIICAWMRVIGILTTTRSFGPFLRIIYLLLSTVMNFLLVFFAVTTLFAQVFTILFRHTNDNFKGFFTSWVNLFNSALGIQDFTQFTIMKVLGYSLLMAYTTGTNIILLNLVVAIINNLFHFFEKKADAENRAVLVLSYERIKWDEDYGLLILLPAPFNLLSSLFSLILIFSKDKHKKNLNEIFSKTCYFVVAFTNFLILVLTSILLFPITYVKSLIHSAYDNSGKFSISNLPHVLFHSTIRPFIFIYYILDDIKHFWRLCYKENLLENKENRRSLINRDVIMTIRKVLFHYRFDQKKKIISIDELYNRIGLNHKKHSNLNKLPSDKMDSSIDAGSESDNSNYNSDNEYVDNQNLDEINSQMNQSNGNIHESMNTQSKQNFTSNQEQEGMSTQEKQLAYKYIIDKIVDKDRFIDIERTLFILPARVKYTEHFSRSLTFLNMRVVLSGLQKYFFLNAFNNPIYSYKKLQQLIYKILIKFKMIYYFLPENQMNQVKTDFKIVNGEEKYSKSYENLIKMEQNDEFSDYDDQGIFDQLSKIPTNKTKKVDLDNTIKSLEDSQIPVEQNQPKDE